MNNMLAVCFALFAAFSNGFVASERVRAEESVAYWCAPMTYKVTKDETPLDTENKKINIRLAKNETECAQFFLKPQKKISSYKVTVGALTGKSGTIPSENVKLYKQSYIEVTVPKNTAFPVGWYPDALIPLEKVTEKGENYIEAGDNQGFVLSVKTDKNTVAGIYSSTLTVSADGINYDFPVTVEVWDFSVPDEVHTQSSFFTRRDWLAFGELDNTIEMEKKYFDYFLDHRISSLYLPSELNNLDCFIASLKEYYDNPKFSAYMIPHRTKTIYNYTTGQYETDVDYDVLTQYIDRLVAESVSDGVDYFTKAYYYIYDLIDEPQLNGKMDIVNGICQRIEECGESVIRKHEAENVGYFDGTTIKESIRNIPNLVTTNYDERLTANDWCPTVDQFSYAENRQIYANEQDKGKTVWWYTCMVPINPYPTYHINDNLLSSRIMSWMQMQYNISGNLYYSTNMYPFIDERGDNVQKDYYQTPIRLPGVTNGDGFLVYPGRPYGIDGPVGTMRLESIRDGLEDYEYLWLVKQKYAELADYYGLTELSADGVLNGIYSKLFSGTIPTSSTETFNECRNEVAGLLLDLQNNESKLVYEDIDIDLTRATIKLLVGNDYEIRRDNLPLNYEKAGNGKRYTIQMNLTNESNYLKFSVVNLSDEKDVQEITRFISSKVNINGFEQEKEVEGVEFNSTNSSKSIGSAVARSGNSMQVNISSRFTGNNNLDRAYRPNMSFTSKMFGGNALGDIDTVSVWIYNDDDTDTAVNIYIAGPTAERKLQEVKLKSKAWTKVEISQIYNLNWTGLASAQTLRFDFANEGDILNPRIYSLYCDDMTYTLKGVNV